MCLHFLLFYSSTHFTVVFAHLSTDTKAKFIHCFLLAKFFRLFLIFTLFIQSCADKYLTSGSPYRWKCPDLQCLPVSVVSILPPGLSRGYWHNITERWGGQRWSRGSGHIAFLPLRHNRQEHNNVKQLGSDVRGVFIAFVFFFFKT